MKKTTDKKVLICVGAGGVGKTTVASLLGAYYASLGLKALVITVDPARRLLDALGLKGTHTTPKKVDLSHVTSVKPGGALFAFMPDLKKEWMDFLRDCIERDEMRHEIASNHFYRYMADGLPGAFEIICSHVLFRLRRDEDFDIIVLDTPPSSHSVSFFDVPKKVSNVLEHGVFRKLLSRRNAFLLKVTKKLALFSGGVIENTLERLIGSTFLSELIDFSLTIDALYDPMLERARAMDALLKSPSTDYVLVVRPTVTSVDDSFNLHESLKKRGIKINEVVMNQVSPTLNEDEINKELEALHEHAAGNEGLKLIDEMVLLHRNEVVAEGRLIDRVAKSFDGASIKTLTLAQSLHKTSIIAHLLSSYKKQV